MYASAMKKKYFTYFENPFLALRMPRPAYKEQAQHTVRAVREANLGAALEALATALETETNGFDENLIERAAPTAGDTSAYHTARQAWLDFVEDTYIDFVKPKLRKLPVFADFRPFGKSKLDALDQAAIITKSDGLITLYTANQALMGYPTLAKDAQKKLKAMTDVDEIRDTKDAATDATILDLLGDRRAIALAQRRVKAQLELLFDDPAKVYSFFDFSAASVNKSGKVKVVTGTTPA